MTDKTKAALAELGSWLKGDASVEDLVSKALDKLRGDETRRTWSNVAIEVRKADWPQFAQMSGLPEQEPLEFGRYETFKERLCKEITDYWTSWLNERRRNQDGETERE